MSKYNILYLNINSIFNKLHDLEDIINELGNIHIIALTEIRLLEEQNFGFNINGYKAYFNNRADGHGGVALFIHDSLISGVMLNDCVENIHRLVVRVYSLNINISVIYKQPKANPRTFIRLFRDINQL